MDEPVDENLLTADDILSANDITIEWCPVPEWGNGKGGVYARSLMGDELDLYQGSLLVKDGPENASPLVYQVGASYTQIHKAGML